MKLTLGYLCLRNNSPLNKPEMESARIFTLRFKHIMSLKMEAEKPSL